MSPPLSSEPAPDLSVIIPVYNRDEVIRYTLESVRRASAGLAVETIVVDDGSTTPTAGVLARLGFSPTKLIRQENRGLLFARLTGLGAATGRHVLFLDSDDLVSADKFTAQVSAMDRTGADVSYTDTGRATLVGDYDALSIALDSPLRATSDAAEFFIEVQPAPHSPMFRRAYLDKVVQHAFFPPAALYNSVAEIWFYHNAAPFPGRVLYVPGPHAIIGQHPGMRLTSYWEKLALASLGVMEAFGQRCPDGPTTRRVRRLVAQKAFHSWRWLPRGFSPEFCARELAIWERLDDRRHVSGGGPTFQFLSLLLGPVRAARLLQLKLNGPYESCRTMTDAEFALLLAKLPPP